MTHDTPHQMEALPPEIIPVESTARAPVDAPACPACGARMEHGEESGMSGLPGERRVWICPICGAREPR